MPSVDGSTVFPLSPEETWDLLFGDRLRNIVQFSPTVAAIEDYELRPDGTPRYTMVNKIGPFRKRSTSDYFVYERPARSANRVFGLPLGGEFHMTFQPVSGGTRVSAHWQVQTQHRLAGLFQPLIHRLLTSYLQRELDAWARGAGRRDEDS